MSASTFKGGLAVGGSAFDKSKLQMRRPTPDSDVLASSDEDRDHVPPARSVNTAYPAGRRPSSGWLQDIQPNRKYSLPSVSFAGSQPTTPSLELPQQTRPTTSSFPWNTSSFTSNSASTRLKEVLPSPTSAYATGERPLPSPTTTPEGEETIGFLLNQSNSVRKAVRSQSYSVGQSETDASPAQASNRLRSSLRHRPSKPSLLGESAAGLGQLREDDIYEMDSNTVDAEQGVRLPMNYWEREQRDLKHQALLKQAAEQNARRNRATSSGSPVAQHPRRTPQSNRNVPQSDYAVEEHEDNDRFSEATKSSLTRRFSEHVGSIGRDIGADTMGASVSQDWMGNVPAFTPDALGRRHSFAHYTSHTSTFQLPTLGNTQEEDEEEELSPLQTSESPGPPENFDHNAYFSGYGPASRALNASSISAAHPDPILSNVPSTTPNPYTVPSTLGRPGRRIYVVAFKCSRADIFYTYDNTGLEIRRGDLVVCEGDRGVDLGQVTHADVSLDDAKKYKAQALEEHFRWLVMFSQYSVAGTGNSNPMLGSLARANGVPNNAQRAQLTGMGAQQDPDAKPKMIKRLAQQHEIYGLRDKEGQEAKAKRLAVTKTADHGFPMEILDAEFQADNHKITFFYYAEHYVNFNPLVADLFKHYKIRIWMSAVNPASVVNPAGLMQVPPPSAIGPGAILHSSNSNASLSVGPGFGNPYRSNEQRGRGRGQNVQQGNLDETFFPFANQVPLISSQQAYPMPQWGHAQAMGPDMYGRFGGSPMNYGAWYPPTTFSASPAFNNASSNASYRGGYPASTSAPTAFPGVGPNLGGIYGQYLAAQYNAYGGGNNAGHGNQGNARQQSGHGTPAGHSATPGSSSTATPAASSALNGDLAAALADMALNK